MCVALSICVNLPLCLNLCVGPHFLVHLSVGLSFSGCECMCVRACCFNSGGQAAANSSHEGAPRGAVRRIRRLMASPEQSPAHYQLGRSSCLSPGAACQVTCPLPYSSLPFLSLQVNARLKERGQGSGAKAELCIFQLTLTLRPNRRLFLVH